MDLLAELESMQKALSEFQQKAEAAMAKIQSLQKEIKDGYEIKYSAVLESKKLAEAVKGQ